MKKLICILSIVICAMSVSAQESARITSGQSIAIRTTTSVSSKSKNPNITAIVERDVKDYTGEIVLIRRGTPVETALNVTKAKGVGKAGSINISFLTTTSVDGQTISLLGGISREGANKEGAALGCGLGLGLTFLFPEGLFLLCIKGENVTIPENTIVNSVVINDNYTIKLD